jgi:hypothetical protein
VGSIAKRRSLRPTQLLFCPLGGTFRWDAFFAALSCCLPALTSLSPTIACVEQAEVAVLDAIAGRSEAEAAKAH